MHPTAYSLPQRVLHWLMALLIFFNLIFSDGMEHWSRLLRHGQPVTPDDVGSANIHAYVGIAILVLALCRLALRLVQARRNRRPTSPRSCAWWRRRRMACSISCSSRCRYQA